MTRHHPLDGNMIAADAHYERPHPDDHDFCDRCGRPFHTPDVDGVQWDQHPVLFMLCTDCGDLMEGEE